MPVGPPVIVVSGAVVSTVNVRVAGVGSTLPAASSARTRNVYVPSASGPSVRGEVQARRCRSPAGAVEPALERRARLAGERERGDAFVIVPVGPRVIVVSGAVVSTVNVRVAGVGSTLPAASVARTENVYVPSASEPRIRGEVHDAYVPVVAPGPSSVHSNVAPVSVAENVNDGEFVVIVPVGR